MENDSILSSIKDNVGISEQDTAFDNEILLHINLAFSTLFEIGVGNDIPIRVENKESTWSDLFSDYDGCIGFIKEYTYLKVRTLFDPPTNSVVFESMKNLMTELEWRIRTFIEGLYIKEEKDTSYGTNECL